ncbi:hypothetical protein J437_LFUL007119 [Ladona fulva]|uniref:Uncharacterized protein n=1 Tax=Ladona fulva TaxID=123851 RepID=A0A8K0K3V3_LADFU|nr:hypothetical protein J437_LFUL007119 [Ladona fulva]
MTSCGPKILKGIHYRRRERKEKVSKPIPSWIKKSLGTSYSCSEDDSGEENLGVTIKLFAIVDPLKTFANVKWNRMLKFLKKYLV